MSAWSISIYFILQNNEKFEKVWAPKILNVSDAAIQIRGNFAQVYVSKCVVNISDSIQSSWWEMVIYSQLWAIQKCFIYNHFKALSIPGFLVRGIIWYPRLTTVYIEIIRVLYTIKEIKSFSWKFECFCKKREILLNKSETNVRTSLKRIKNVDPQCKRFIKLNIIVL